MQEDDGSSPQAVEARETVRDTQAAPVTEAGVGQGAFIAVPVKNTKAYRKLRDSIGDGRMDLILKLNRRDSRHIRRNDTLIVPADYNEMALSPFPLEVQHLQHIPKIILVSRRVQAFAAYEFGRLVRWGPVSTGKRSTPTPTGLFQANWKDKDHISSIDSTWFMPYTVNITRSGVALHGYGVPGYPASHSCVRLWIEDAEWVFYWVDLKKYEKGKLVRHGTPVIIFDEYEFGVRAPWRRLPQDPKAHNVDPLTLNSVLNEHMGELLARQNVGIDTVQIAES